VERLRAGGVRRRSIANVRADGIDEMVASRREQSQRVHHHHRQVVTPGHRREGERARHARMRGARRGDEPTRRRTRTPVCTTSPRSPAASACVAHAMYDASNIMRWLDGVNIDESGV
jgi:hypothetical protein